MSYAVVVDIAVVMVNKKENEGRRKKTRQTEDEPDIVLLRTSNLVKCLAFRKNERSIHHMVFVYKMIKKRWI